MIFKFLVIAVIWVIILDLTDFMPTVKGWLSSILTKGKSHNNDYRLKPLDCSLCMTWWSLVLLLFLEKQFALIYIMLALVTAWITPIIKDILILGFDTVELLINKLHKMIYGKK